MPQTLIVVFLLFFAVLAFAWFYWQRAKARTADVAISTPAEAAPTTVTPTAATATEPAETTESTPAS